MARGETERTLQISSLQRLNLSVNGNPRFLVTFTDGTEAQTQSDAALGYEIDNPEWRGVPIVVTFTRAGRVCRIRHPA